MLRYITAGESHGKELTVIIEGLPAGLKIAAADIDRDLARRQLGYGRGARMKIEKDRVEFTAGVRFGETIGSPVCMVVRNFDWENWKRIMAAGPEDFDEKVAQVRPRPGHADLPAALKYDRRDLRDILERASARETAVRVAAGALCRRFLAEFGISIYSLVREIGGVTAELPKKITLEALLERIEQSPVRAADPEAEKKMIGAIAAAEEKGDTLGGIFAVITRGVPPGLGSHAQWDRKLDANIARGLLSIQAVKGVSFGLGFAFGEKRGSQAHDEIYYDTARGFYRKTNNAGGIEGGISNGEDIVVNCVMKPIPSLKRPMNSVNLKTRTPDKAEAVRSDVCAVPAAAVIGEAALAFELARAFLEKFGGDGLRETARNYTAYLEQIKEY
jgi:chorismate synthase